MNRRMSVVLAVTMILGLSGCSTLQEQSPEEILMGSWKPEGSFALYRIAFEDGAVTVSGHSEKSGKRLTILDAEWDGEVLRFTSYMASTNIKVIHENRITGTDTMVSSIVENKTGQPRAHTRVWRKIKSDGRAD